MESDAMTKPTVFISYNHENEDWKDRLITHLGVLQQEGLLDLWDDRRIGAGEDWYQEIHEAMDAASVAVLMVSANFLTVSAEQDMRRRCFAESAGCYGSSGYLYF